MQRVYYDASQYYKEKAKLPSPDGKHCIICGKSLPKYRRKYCSDECLWTWLGTIAVKDWSIVRDLVLERDHHTCQSSTCCSKENLEVHHIIPIHDGGDEFDMDNCITLCHDCHVEAHRKHKAERRKKGQASLTLFSHP